MENDTRLALARDLVLALEQGDENTADAVLDEISGLRETELFQEIGQLTRQLHDTMTGFTLDAKIVAMTEHDMPDAKERLQHVISMTEQAANQTLNAVESILPVSQSLNEQVGELSEKWGRFLDKKMPFEEFKSMSAEITSHFNGSKDSIQQVQDGLNEILMAQGFQDITGQIIKRVINLVQDLEISMVGLISIAGNKSTETKSSSEPELPGPIVPGLDDKEAGAVASSQDDVDDLLSSLGF